MEIGWHLVARGVLVWRSFAAERPRCGKDAAAAAPGTTMRVGSEPPCACCVTPNDREAVPQSALAYATGFAATPPD
jgi:hypothetical protein